MGTTALEEAARQVCDVLNPTLARFGFAGGQVGFAKDSFSVLFCAAYDDYVDAFPELEDAGYYAAGNGACIDLHVNGTATGELSDADLEGTPLATMLRTAGFTDLAESVERLQELTPHDALAAIATATSALFTRR